MKKIKFTPQSKETSLLEPTPKPAKFHVPDWYRDSPKSVTKEKELSDENGIAKMTSEMATFKECIPFIDTLTSGYMLTLPATIRVYQQQNELGNLSPYIKWNVGWDLVDTQDSLTFPNYPVPQGCSSTGFRWLNNWKIETPAGYSSLIIHPLHRHDLPFYTLTGFIDTDKMPNAVVFPFFIKEGFEGDIPMGTPIAQVIPVKRENWETEKGEYHEDMPLIRKNNIKMLYVKTYKKLYWSKKSYN